MATINERAEKWAQEHAPTRLDGVELDVSHARQFRDWLRDAYLAGSEQTQADYTRSGPLTVRFHAADDCPGHTVGKPGEDCARELS